MGPGKSRLSTGFRDAIISRCVRGTNTRFGRADAHFGVPEQRGAIGSEMHRIDVRDIASHVKVPTLVLHSNEDEAVPFEERRLLASLIPNSQFIALQSRNHLLVEGELAWSKFVEAVREFLVEDTGWSLQAG